jgi:perosamine synthetase
MDSKSGRGLAGAVRQAPAKAKVLPYGRQCVTERDVAAVAGVLCGDWITQGPKIAEFEASVAAYCGARFAVAVCNGTAALHLACLAAEVKPGHVGVTSPISFVASANCLLYCQGLPAFVDIDPRSITLDPHQLEILLLRKAAAGSQVRVLVPVHFGGYPCDMVAIAALARRFGCTVIEDAAHALGAEYEHNHGGNSRWARVGACEHSDMAVLSFHPVKHITTGEGGMVLTNDAALARRLRDLRTHGITRDPARLRANDGPWFYEMQSLGFNYRITDFQCALGLSQLQSLDCFLARRREIAAAYQAAFEKLDELILPPMDSGARPAWHLYVVQLRLERLTAGRLEIFQALRQEGLGVNVHYIPIHLQPYYREKFSTAPGDFPHAETYYARAISLPMYPAMTDDDVQHVVSAVRQVLRRFRRP